MAQRFLNTSLLLCGSIKHVDRCQTIYHYNSTIFHRLPVKTTTRNTACTVCKYIGHFKPSSSEKLGPMVTERTEEDKMRSFRCSAISHQKPPPVLPVSMRTTALSATRYVWRLYYLRVVYSHIKNSMTIGLHSIAFPWTQRVLRQTHQQNIKHEYRPVEQNATKTVFSINQWRHILRPNEKNAIPKKLVGAYSPCGVHDASWCLANPSQKEAWQENVLF